MAELDVGGALGGHTVADRASRDARRARLVPPLGNVVKVRVTGGPADPSDEDRCVNQARADRPIRRLRNRLPLLLVVWGLATAIGLQVAATTRIGPVLVKLSYRHGVHLGDLLAFAACYGVALLITVWIAHSR